MVVKTVLYPCSSLPRLVPFCLDVLLPLSTDDFQQVSTSAAQALSALQLRIANNEVTSERRLSDVIAERIDHVVTKLPRVMRNVGKF